MTNKSFVSMNVEMPPRRMAYSLTEVALLLGVSYVTVWRLMKRDLIRASRVLRTPKISHEELERFLRETADSFFQGRKCVMRRGVNEEQKHGAQTPTGEAV